MQKPVVAPIKSFQVNHIQIDFKDSMYNASYSLYNQQVHSIWLRGRITEVDHDHQYFDIDDGYGRSLRVQFCRRLLPFQIANPETLTVDSLVSIVCGITHLIINGEAYLNFKLNRICKVAEIDPDVWSSKIDEWLEELSDSNDIKTEQ